MSLIRYLRRLQNWTSVLQEPSLKEHAKQPVPKVVQLVPDLVPDSLLPGPQRKGQPSRRFERMRRQESTLAYSRGVLEVGVDWLATVPSLPLEAA